MSKDYNEMCNIAADRFKEVLELRKALNRTQAQLNIFDRKYNELKDKYFTLVEDRKPRPIDKDTPRGKAILILVYGIWSQGHIDRSRKSVYIEDGEEYVNMTHATHWLPLPVIEGSDE